MPCLSVDGGPDGPTDTVGTPKNLTGERVWFFAFSPSARRTPNAEEPVLNNYARTGDFSRESNRTYSVGYSERCNFETGGAANWKWRRMVISINSDIYDIFPEDTLEYYDHRAIPFPGQVRTMFDFAQNVFVQEEFCRRIFEGTQGVDWADLFNAKLARKRVRVIYDKVRVISGGNNAAHWGGAKHWFPHRENLIYGEQEAGGKKQRSGNTSRFVWPEGQTGGNLMVIDIFACANGAASNQMRWSPTGTYYWHER